MTRPRPPRRPAADAARLVAVYVALILLWQCIAAAAALGAGPLHRHISTAPSLSAAVFSHHAQAHLSGQRHVHAPTDSSVVALPAEDTPDLLAFALTSALALLALDSPRPSAHAIGAVQCAALAWACTTARASLPFRPPRHG